MMKVLLPELFKTTLDNSPGNIFEGEVRTLL